MFNTAQVSVDVFTFVRGVIYKYNFSEQCSWRPLDDGVDCM